MGTHVARITNPMSDSAILTMQVARADSDDINTSAIVAWGLISVAVTIISICGLAALYYSAAADQQHDKSYGAIDAPAIAELSRQEAELWEPIRWTNFDRSTAGVPIDRAKELVISEYVYSPKSPASQ